jgi:hypothetical protein
MPFALIPDGFSLVKVTKAQEKAVSDKRRHDDVVALLNNPNTPLVVAGLAGAVLIPVFAEEIAERLGAPIEDVKEAVSGAATKATASPLLIGADLLGKLDIDKLFLGGREKTGTFTGEVVGRR